LGAAERGNWAIACMQISRTSHRLVQLAFFGTAVGFLVWFGWNHLGTMPPLSWGEPRVAGALAGAAGAYLAGLVFMAHAWRVLLRGFGDRPPNVLAEAIELSTQAAKYIPGNVAHLAGRIALAKTHGFSITRATAALVVQHVLAGYLAVLLMGLGFFATPDIYGPVEAFLPPRPILVALVAGGTVLPFVMGPLNRAIGRRMPRRLREIGYQLDQLRRRDIALGIALMFAFMVCGGLVLDQSAHAVLDDGLPFLPAGVLFAVAWIAGTATPGAPGGLGVRETVLSLGLTPLIGGGPALSVALVARLATVFGDMVASLAGAAALRRLAPRLEEPPDPD